MLNSYFLKYQGIVTSSGSLWKEHRTFTLSALREFGFGKRSLESKIVEEIEVFVKEIQSKNGAPFNIRYLLNVCISNIMCSISFGQRYDHSDRNFQTLSDKVNQSVSNENLLFVATVLPFVKYIPGDPCQLKSALSNQQCMNDHLKPIITEHEETYDEENLRDYVDVYLKKMKSEEGNPNTTFDGK
jgi:hypothetical protein